jgi:hypothetical protein
MANITSNPTSLGSVVVPVPGVPQRITKNFPEFTSSPPKDTDLWCNQLEIFGLPDNTGNVYIGNSAMNKTTLAGVYHILGATDTRVFSPPATGMNTIYPGDYYVDADDADDGVLASAQIL